MVNNAGVAPKVRADVLEATEESFESVLKVNLQGPYFLTQAVANWMIQQKKAEPAWRGCIVNVSSISATVASVNRGDYCISKAGIAMATQLWASRLGEFDIPVYEVRPGVIKTDMTAGVTAKYDKLLGEGLAIQRRWGQTGGRRQGGGDAGAGRSTVFDRSGHHGRWRTDGSTAVTR